MATPTRNPVTSVVSPQPAAPVVINVDGAQAGSPEEVQAYNARVQAFYAATSALPPLALLPAGTWASDFPPVEPYTRNCDTNCYTFWCFACALGDAAVLVNKSWLTFCACNCISRMLGPILSVALPNIDFSRVTFCAWIVTYFQLKSLMTDYAALRGLPVVTDCCRLWFCASCMLARILGHEKAWKATFELAQAREQQLAVLRAQHFPPATGFDKAAPLAPPFAQQIGAAPPYGAPQQFNAAPQPYGAPQQFYPSPQSYGAPPPGYAMQQPQRQLATQDPV